MKGVFVAQQLQFQVDVAVDRVTQGASLPCTLTVKNLAATPQTLAGVGLSLCVGDVKKLKESPTDFEVVATAQVDLGGALAPQASTSAQYTFTLDRNCVVTEKSYTLFCRYGFVEGPSGDLPVTVVVHPHLEKIGELLESTFQFTPKGVRSSKGWTELKYKPSSSRRYSFVNELVLGARFEAGELVLQFRFNVKKFEGLQANVQVSRGKTVVERRLAESAYIKDGFLDHATVEGAMNDALEVVSRGF